MGKKCHELYDGCVPKNKKVKVKVIGCKGPQGDQGPQGNGTQGFQGPQGQGDQGPQGPEGPSSLFFVETGTGPTGPPSTGPFALNNLETIRFWSNTIDINAEEGSVLVNFEVLGFTGAQGDQGPQGADGVQGDQGPQGMGAQGFQGPQGADGVQGDQGPQGMGAQGFQGPQGADGVQGVQGPQGMGAQGFQGSDGVQGNQGPQGMGAQGFQGDQGPQGSDGVQGDQGPQGADGDQGAQGPQGVDGDQGTQGPQGSDGDQGTQGPQGVDGDQGTQGPQGVDGDQGPQGVDGDQGTQGPQGADGVQGDQGPQGMGAQGFQGDQGPQGSQGVQGDQGPQGMGAQGFQGDQGPQGDQGLQGPQGMGAQGLQGDQGDQGPQGAQGDQGPQGMGAQGFQGDQGDQGLQGAQGDQGPQGMGAQGLQGDQGPQGVQGDQGPQGMGAQGLQGDQGPQGVQGDQGPQGMGAQGLQGDQGPQGVQGNQGPQGMGAQGFQGGQGPQGVQGDQGAQGVSAPGTQGDQGPQGEDGSQGFQGPQGVSAPGTQGLQGPQGPQGVQGFQGLQGPTPTFTQGNLNCIFNSSTTSQSNTSATFIAYTSLDTSITLGSTANIFAQAILQTDAQSTSGTGAYRIVIAGDTGPELREGYNNDSSPEIVTVSYQTSTELGPGTYTVSVEFAEIEGLNPLIIDAGQMRVFSCEGIVGPQGSQGASGDPGGPTGPIGPQGPTGPSANSGQLNCEFNSSTTTQETTSSVFTEYTSLTDSITLGSTANIYAHAFLQTSADSTSGTGGFRMVIGGDTGPELRQFYVDSDVPEIVSISYQTSSPLGPGTYDVSVEFAEFGLDPLRINAGQMWTFGCESLVGPTGEPGATGPAGAPTGPTGAQGNQGPEGGPGPLNCLYETSTTSQSINSTNFVTYSSLGANITIGSTVNIYAQAILQTDAQSTSGTGAFRIVIGGDTGQTMEQRYNNNNSPEIISVDHQTTTPFGPGTYAVSIEFRDTTGDLDPLRIDRGELFVLGCEGSIGATGFQGDQGPQGSLGFQGPQGVEGPQGFQGETGDPGGPTGPTGPQGIQGPQGSQGSQGFQGFQGPQGSQGTQGQTGDPGGPTGPTGPQGFQGPSGTNGAQGAQGPQGPSGLIGDITNEGVSPAPNQLTTTGVLDLDRTLTYDTDITNQMTVTALTSNDAGSSIGTFTTYHDKAVIVSADGNIASGVANAAILACSDVVMLNDGFAISAIASNLSGFIATSGQPLEAAIVACSGCTVDGSIGSGMFASEGSNLYSSDRKTAIVASDNCGTDPSTATNEAAIVACEGCTISTSAANVMVGSSRACDVTLPQSAIFSSLGVRTGRSLSVCGGSGAGTSTANRTWQLVSDSGRVESSLGVFGGAITGVTELFENGATGVVPYGRLLKINNGDSGLADGTVSYADENTQGELVSRPSSGASLLLGESHFCWQGRYLKDNYGQYQTEEVSNPELSNPDLTQEEIDELPATITQYVTNPNYDPDAEYMCRCDRPEEWTCCEMMGRVAVDVESTVNVGDYLIAGVNGVGRKFTPSGGVNNTNIRCIKLIDAGSEPDTQRVMLCTIYMTHA